MELRGERVVLRPLAEEDVPRLVEIGTEPEVARWWQSLTEEKLRARIGSGRALTIVAAGEVAGMIEWHEGDDPEYRSAGMDLFLSAAVHGRGLGTDAVRTLARWLVRERGHHRLTIDPAAHNAAAIRCFEKAGFKPVGIMRDYWLDPDGVWRDGLLMDLLARDV